jgi:hypothetical protein
METEENELEDMSEGRGFNAPDITMSARVTPPTPEPVREEVKPRESTDDDDALSFFANLAEFDD